MNDLEVLVDSLTGQAAPATAEASACRATLAVLGVAESVALRLGRTLSPAPQEVKKGNVKVVSTMRSRTPTESEGKGRHQVAVYLRQRNCLQVARVRSLHDTLPQTQGLMCSAVGSRSGGITADKAWQRFVV